MRRSISRLLLGAALVFAGSAAQGLPYTGAIVFQVGSLPAVALPGSGTGDPLLPSISAGAFVGSASSPVATSAPISQVFVSLAANSAGTVGSGPSFAGGTIQLRGFGFGATLVRLFLVGGRLGFASAVAPPFHTGGSGNTSAHFGAWTSGVASVLRTHTLLTAACVASANSASCPTGMLGGATANALFFGGVAQIVLVAPIDLYTITGGIGGIPTFAVMALNYVPEPGTLLLLGSGVAALSLAGRRRMGSQRKLRLSPPRRLRVPSPEDSFGSGKR